MIASAYTLQLFSWIFLAPVIVGRWRRGEKAFGLLAVLALNLLFLFYEGYMTFVWSKTVVAPIRIDIFLVSFLLIIVNSLTGLSVARHRSVAGQDAGSERLERSLGLVLIAIALYAVAGLVMVHVHGRQASQTISRQKKQEFELMFQDAQTVEHYFGDLRPGASDWPGHYAADPAAHGWLTRLIINREGKVWLFFTCQSDAECVYVQGQDASLPANRGDRVRIDGLKPEVGAWTSALELKKEAAGRLRVSLSMDGPPSPNAAAWAPTTKDLLFVKTDPPAFPRAASAQGPVRFLGVFSNGYLTGSALFVVQMWLWQEDNRLWGRYLRRGWQRGTRGDFISAEGVKGTFDPGSGRIAFTVSAQESFEGTLVPGPAIDGQVLWSGRPLEHLTLKNKELIPGFPYAYAPVTSAKATQDWLETASFGKMVSWQVPAAFDPTSEW